MSHSISRRTVLQGVAAIGGGVWLGAAPNLSRAAAGDKLNIAVIGVGGRGAANLNGVSKENIVALCDVDDARAGKAFERFPQAQKFYDFRRMFDQMEKQIDAVVVSTPDHTHFHPSMAALVRGKHLYCEKPMAHNVHEARQMTDTARKMNVATQLGVQRHTIDNMHRVVELIQSGAIGDVSEVYSWIGGSRGMPKVPDKGQPVPSHLKWDLWLGPAKERPYHQTYCPYGWRFWWDFGTGETGNWGCHILDIPYWSLGLTTPTRVQADGPPVHPETTPRSMQCRFEFPAAGGRGPVVLHWAHAKNGPDILREHNLSPKGKNTLFIGSKGMLLCGFGSRQLLPRDKFEGFEAPPKTIPDSPGFYNEWLSACRGGEAATCNFDYSGPMAETVLLGNVAYRAGGFDWDASSLKTAGNGKAQELIQEDYRKGWEV